MAKTLVIGGSGFLGSHVADILTTKGHEVYIYDIEKSKYLSSSQKMIVGDILDKKLIDKSVSKVDYVYHFAAVADIKEAKDNPIESARFNIIGTLNILDACKKFNVRRIIFSSSIYVYSNHGSFYRTTKQSCELFIENYLEEFNVDFLNDTKKKNNILLKRSKKNYEIYGKIFDGTKLLEEILESDSEGNVFSILNNFNSSVKISLKKVFIDDINYLNNLSGNLKFNKSDLKNLNLNASFPGNKKLTFTIKTDQNNQKVTTLFSDYAKPLVKKYKFIKGFEDGYLDFYSVKKNKISNSNLKINDFKLNELPALTKILTLASLQGIADLLTGEGIRFNEFEMKFRNEKKLMTIDEIYAIGPAISIMMDGYVQNDELISLRGTLVPATTLNKVIGSLPLLGDILVGKKTGEGVFGVSFKIKGPTKKLKTTVNPIKTLTPRFITRTLEKIKKN